MTLSPISAFLLVLALQEGTHEVIWSAHAVKLLTEVKCHLKRWLRLAAQCVEESKSDKTNSDQKKSLELDENAPWQIVFSISDMATTFLGFKHILCNTNG